MRGGGGADLFQYRSAGDSLAGLQDRIYDFEHGADASTSANIDADINAAGDQAFTVHVGGELSGAAGEVRAGYDADAGLCGSPATSTATARRLLIEVIVQAGAAARGQRLHRLRAGRARK